MRLFTLYCLLILVGFGTAPGQGTKKVVPCASAQTQTDMNICWGNEYKSADATLNQIYRQLVAKLDEGEKTQLKDVESAWLKYRDANCDFVADQYKGGTIRPMIDAICLTDMTKNRTAELRNQIKDRSN
jgi:uncharacterized protein YecT (DUF1311 family)